MTPREQERFGRAFMHYADVRIDERLGKGDERAVTAARRAVRQVIRETFPAELTTREFETLKLMAEGLTNAEIAARLTISSQTVKHHSIHLFQKLGAHDRLNAVLTAIRWGLIDPILPEDSTNE